MKICILGNKSTTKNLLQNFYANNIKIDYLVTLNPDSAKKLHIAGRSDELEHIAKIIGAKVYQASSYKLSSEEDQEFFDAKSFDVGVSTGWQRIIPNQVLQTFDKGVFGWHGSGFEFPNGRGRSPLNWSIRLGLSQVYHNCFKYSNGVDNGEIYNTATIPIEANDYIDDLQRKATKHILDTSVELIRDIVASKCSLKEQIDYPFITFPQLDENSGQLFPRKMSATAAFNIIRSCSKPFPGAFIINSQKKIRIWKAKVIKSKMLDNANSDGVYVSEKVVKIPFIDGTNEFDIEKL